MNKATEKCLRKLELTIIPVKQPKPTFNKKGQTDVYYDWVLKPHYILGWKDDISYDIYKRIPNSCYWRLVGLKGYEFAIIARLSI